MRSHETDLVESFFFFLMHVMSGCRFLLVLAHPGSPRQMAVKQLFVYSKQCRCCVCVQIRVTVLYVNPTTKVLSLSELTHLVTPDLAPLQLFSSVQLGTVIDEAVVTRVDSRHGIYLRLPDKLKAFASVCARRQSSV